MTVKTDNSAKVMRQRFGAWLREKREEAGMTQLEVAAMVNYGYSVMVSQIERGGSALPTHDMRLWAEVLRVNPEEFAQMYMYYCQPFIYECLYGKDPYAAEKLPRSPRTIMAAPGRPPMRSPRARKSA